MQFQVGAPPTYGYLLVSITKTMFFFFGGCAATMLREYPGPFGLKMVDLYESLVHEKEGCPILPDVVPPSTEAFSEMEWGDDADSSWSESKIVEVCRYLRGGKSLMLPDEFRYLIPNRL